MINIVTMTFHNICMKHCYTWRILNSKIVRFIHIFDWCTRSNSWLLITLSLGFSVTLGGNILTKLKTVRAEQCNSLTYEDEQASHTDSLWRRGKKIIWIFIEVTRVSSQGSETKQKQSRQLDTVQKVFRQKHSFSLIYCKHKCNVPHPITL
jgi:hypothetical protein